jgi:uncharacterized damage-inducible protein DinB
MLAGHQGVYCQMGKTNSEDHVMRKLISAIFVGLMLAASATAQTQQSAPPSSTGFLKNMYRNNRGEILRSAEKFPEQFYGLRPGPQTEVRTFGQLVGHLANFNYLWCSQAKNENNPMEGKDFEKLTSKADLAKALNDAFAYCDSVYNALTDVSGQEILEITQENGGKRRINRLSLLVLNYGHNEHHYGNMITYMRMKSVVPASSEPR